MFLGLYTVSWSFVCIASNFSLSVKVLTYIDVSAVEAGVPDDLAFYLLAIANACSAVGRITGGVLSDRAGTYAFSAV